MANLTMTPVELVRRIYHYVTWDNIEGRESDRLRKICLSIKYDCFIDRRAHIFNYRTIKFGKWSRISRECLLNYMVCSRREKTLSIGDHSFIGPFCIVNPQTSYIDIGNNCSINAFSRLYGGGGLVIRDNTRIGTGAIILPMNHVFEGRDVPIMQQGETRNGITIGSDVWIGAGVKILDGVEVGDGCVIGAGAVVTKTIPPYSVVVGVPAKVVKKR